MLSASLWRGKERQSERKGGKSGKKDEGKEERGRIQRKRAESCATRDAIDAISDEWIEEGRCERPNLLLALRLTDLSTLRVASSSGSKPQLRTFPPPSRCFRPTPQTTPFRGCLAVVSIVIKDQNRSGINNRVETR